MVSALRFLDGSNGVSFQPSLSRRMDVFYSSRNWADKCLRTSSERSWNWASVSRESSAPLRAPWPGSLRTPPLTQHFIVSVARGADVAKLLSLTELCGLRVSVETFIAPKGPLQCKRCQRFGHTQRYCTPVCWMWWDSPQGSALPHSQRPRLCVVEGELRLLSGRLLNAVRGEAPNPPAAPKMNRVKQSAEE
jgi:hypothetical protein